MARPITSSTSGELSRGTLLLCCALLALWAVGIFDRGLWTPDEPREADIAWRMSAQTDKALPQLAGVTFAEKPPLSYWASAAAIRVFGASAAALRAPNALYLLITVTATALLLSAMRGRRAAFIGCALLCSTFEVLRVGIWLAPDACLLAGCAVALAGLYRGYVTADRKQKLLWYTIMHAGALMAFMAKSAIGWLVPSLTLLTLIAWENRWRELRSRELWFGLFLQFIFIGIWIGYALQQADGMDALHIIFWNNLAGRFTHISAHGLAPDYSGGHRNWPGKYLMEMPYYLLPWFLLLIAACRSFLAQRRNDTLDTAWRFAMAAWVPLLALLSLAVTARDTYFAPAILGVILCITLWVERLAAEAHVIKANSIDMWLLRGTRWLIGLVGAAILAALYVLYRSSSDDADHIKYPLAAAVIAVTLVGSLLGSGKAQHSARFHDSVALCALGFTAVLLTTAVAVFPTMDRWQNLRSIALSVRHDAEKGELAVWNADETTIAILDYYAQFPIVALPGPAGDYAIEGWLSANPRRRLLILVPENSGSTVAHLLHRQRRSSANGSLVESLLRKQSVVIAARYSIPHGRSYLLLANPTTLNESAQPITLLGSHTQHRSESF